MGVLDENDAVDCGEVDDATKPVVVIITDDVIVSTSAEIMKSNVKCREVS